MNNRRKLVIALGAGALAMPFGPFAQQPGKLWRIDFLLEAEQSYYVSLIDAFKVGMRELGYAEGRDYVIEQRSAESEFARLPALAAEFSHIPLIAVRENNSILHVTNRQMEMSNVIEVNSYLEATGIVLALRRGISWESLRRPLHPARRIEIPQALSPGSAHRASS